MAHVGKDYKLWFRRDCNLLLNNNRRGFPEAYKIVAIGPMFSAKYAISLLKNELLINTKKTFDLTWEGAKVGGFFDGCHLEVGLPLEFAVHSVGIDIRIVHDAAIPTPLFSAVYTVGFPFGNYPAWRTNQLVELRYLSPDITLNPDTFSLFIEAAPWSVYNP